MPDTNRSVKLHRRIKCMLVWVNNVYDICDLTILCRGILGKTQIKKNKWPFILMLYISLGDLQYLENLVHIDYKWNVILSNIYETYSVPKFKSWQSGLFRFVHFNYINSRYNLIFENIWLFILGNIYRTIKLKLTNFVHYPLKKPVSLFQNRRKTLKCTLKFTSAILSTILDQTKRMHM